MFYRKFVIMVCAGLTWLSFAASRPAHAAIRASRHPLRVIAYDYAVSQRGKWYCWGGSGPSCYDCSGLVSAAYRHVHILIGRTTYDMLRSGRLIRISRPQARRGDLAFYGRYRPAAVLLVSLSSQPPQWVVSGPNPGIRRIV